VNSELERRMVKAWKRVYQTATERNLTLRIAAYAVALEKVAEATRQRF